MYKEVFEKLAQHYSAGHYETEYRESRQNYFNLIGSFGEDEEFFENQMTRFLEWYLLDRVMDSTGIPPCRLYRLAYSEKLTQEERTVLLAMETSRHSLFQVKAPSNGGTFVIDLLNHHEESFLKDQSYPEFRTTDLIDARVYELDGARYFSDSAWMFPSEMKGWIIDTVRKYFKGDRHQFLIDLAYMKSKRDRFQHVPFDQIFQWEQISKDRELYIKTKGKIKSAQKN